MVEAKILIAGDSKMNQHILSEILGGRCGYLYADDGMQALELLHSEFDIDLLLLDINMPRLDGFGVLEVMKQRNWLQEPPPSSSPRPRMTSRSSRRPTSPA